MKLRVVGLLALVLFTACGKKEAQKVEVDAYMAGLLDGQYENQLGMMLFDPAQIPALLSYADDGREIHPPTNPLSSFHSQCSLGIYALWMIEGIRVAEGGNGKVKASFGYPSLNPLLFDQQADALIYYGVEAYPATQRKAAEAYRLWWNSGEFSQIKTKDPLGGSGLSW